MIDKSEKKARGRPREDKYLWTDLLIIDRAYALATTSRETHPARFWIARVVQSIKNRKPEEVNIWIGLEGGAAAIPLGKGTPESAVVRVMSRMAPEILTVKGEKVGTLAPFYSGPSAPFFTNDAVVMDAPEREYVGPVRFNAGLAEHVDRRRGWKNRKKPD